VAGGDLGQQTDRFLHAQGDVGRVLRGIDAHKGQYTEAELVAVQGCVVAGDVAGLFERTHPAPAGRGRQAHTLGQFGIRQTGVFLQLVEDGPVEFVNLVHLLPLLSKIISNTR